MMNESFPPRNAIWEQYEIERYLGEGGMQSLYAVKVQQIERRITVNSDQTTTYSATKFDHHKKR